MVDHAYEHYLRTQHHNEAETRRLEDDAVPPSAAMMHYITSKLASLDKRITELERR